MTPRARSGAVLAVALVLSLACGGATPIPEGPKTDPDDPAELARLAGDFAGAEAMLKERLRADNTDAATWRLLGDVNLSRGKAYQQRWMKNLKWARESYAGAVAVDPEDCLSWGRLAATLLMASANEQTAASADELDELPLDIGWEVCGGAALLQIEELRRPSPEAVDAARRTLGSKGTPYTALAAAAPNLVAAYERVDVSKVQWKQAYDRPAPSARGDFVVLQTPTVASGVAGAKGRSFTYAERLTITRPSGKNLIYLDARFPQRIPSQGVVKSDGCPGTRWHLEGPDRYPVGQCVAGRYSPAGSPVYEPARLRKAGPSHYEHSRIAGAVVDVFDIAEGSVRCTGGVVGRLMVDVPTCNVDYDQAIRQTRAVSSAAGLTAYDVEHAERMVEAKRMAAVYGEDLATHLSEGNVGIGIPYAMFAYTQPTLQGCKGRGLFSKADIVDDAIEFTCPLMGATYTFRELTLVDIQAAG